LEKAQPALRENRVGRLTENDATVSLNYARIAANSLEDAFEKEDSRTTIGEFRDKAISDIRDPIQRLFPDLVLNGLGNPLVSGTFKFDKGTSKGFQYKNLSGGEKAAFDILLDFVVKKREFNNTVFCIDEPEAHMNPRLQGALLEELFTLLPACSQLWIATHSIGMMRRARDLAAVHPGEVIFVDFEGHDFDHGVSRFRLWFRNLFDYQMFNATKSVSDDRAHKKTSNLYFEIANANYGLTALG